MRLDGAVARKLFTGARVARLATVSGDGDPHLVPFTFAVADDVIFHAVDEKPKSSADLKRLRNIRENRRVAALADGYDEDWSRLWWARADGDAEIFEENSDATRLLAEKYPQYRERRPTGPVVAIRVRRWSGWTANA